MSILVHRTTIACELILPQVARQELAQPLTLIATGDIHTVSLAAGSAAVIVEASEPPTRQPVSGYRVQVFERAIDNRIVDWCVCAEPISADGSAVRYDYLELPDGATAYVDVLVGGNRDELVREALGGALLVVIDSGETAGTPDPDDDDCRPDAEEFVRPRAGAAFAGEE